MNFYQFPLRIKPLSASEIYPEHHVNRIYDTTRNRLLYVDRGEGVFKVKGREVEIKPHYLYIFKKGVDVKMEDQFDFKIFFLNLHVFLAMKLSLFDIIPLKEMYEIENPAFYKNIFQTLVDTQKKEEMVSLNRISLTSLLLSPIETESAIKRMDGLHRDMLRFKSVLEYIDDNFNKNISNNALAKLAHLSPSYFVTKFTKSIGVSPLNYINKIRVEEVKYLLCNSNYTLERIANNVGYKDSSHLTKIFKDQMDVTPGRYRKMYSIGLVN